jgi:hypothetical protein
MLNSDDKDIESLGCPDAVSSSTMLVIRLHSMLWKLVSIGKYLSTLSFVCRKSSSKPVLTMKHTMVYPW